MVPMPREPMTIMSASHAAAWSRISCAVSYAGVAMVSCTICVSCVVSCRVVPCVVCHAMLKEWKSTTHMFGGEEVAEGLHDPNGVVEAGRGDPLHRVLRQQQLGQLLRYHQHHLQHHNNILFCFKIYIYLK